MLLVMMLLVLMVKLLLPLLLLLPVLVLLLPILVDDTLSAADRLNLHRSCGPSESLHRFTG